MKRFTDECSSGEPAMQRRRLSPSNTNADECVLEEPALKRRKLPPLNIVLRLRERSQYGRRKRQPVDYWPRCFYQNVVPNFSVIDVSKPSCYARKFTPDGKHLITFSWDQTAVEVYEYQGCSAAEDLLRCFSGDSILPSNQEQEFVRKEIFGKLFHLKHRIHLNQRRQSAFPLHLNRECSLFTKDGKHVIVVASRISQENEVPSLQTMEYGNSEALYPNGRFLLENYVIYLVNFENGSVADSITIPDEKIALPHNQGLYLYNKTLAILTLCRQEIRLYRVWEDGSKAGFIMCHFVGLFCHDDDRLFWQSTVARGDFKPNHPQLPALKHRLLVYLYQRAIYRAKKEKDNTEIRLFFKHISAILSLRMWKMQLLDEDHILIRYAPEDVVCNRAVDPSSRRSLFVVYQISSTRVIAVWENTSEELLQVLESYCDEFRNTSGPGGVPHPTTSISNNLHERNIHNEYKDTVTQSRGGGRTEATRRCLAPLPLPAQSFSLSPYLDRDLFSFDDKWIMQMERPKMCGESPIRFYHRNYESLAFRLYPSAPVAKRLIAFIFHPTEPLALSVQKTVQDFQLNIHLRHSNLYARERYADECRKRKMQRSSGTGTTTSSLTTTTGSNVNVVADPGVGPSTSTSGSGTRLTSVLSTLVHSSAPSSSVGVTSSPSPSVLVPSITVSRTQAAAISNFLVSSALPQPREEPSIPASEHAPGMQSLFLNAASDTESPTLRGIMSSRTSRPQRLVQRRRHSRDQRLPSPGDAISSPSSAANQSSPQSVPVQSTPGTSSGTPTTYSSGRR
ncbi:unnamed protein product [Cyprideis torosa]|uniref:Uncharacterized protein n=1 Tax=Cyprideis torosa TaxID=163714 RepID=A0A7R8W9W3_9CRUS|nr:unnamed protein product [Cyprideis torosa]CAG0884730.1 unnamed protein product [Cyprideis torosa]